MMQPPPAAEVRATAAAGQQPIAPSFVYPFMVTAAADKLASHLQPGAEYNPKEFYELCLSLARGIDNAVSNNKTLPQGRDLPALLRQVCQRRFDLLLHAAILVLMISVKNACRVGWFEEKERQELYTLANEIGKGFFSAEANTAITSVSVIPTVVSRFYPLMKMGQILASAEVKPGYEAYAIDFHISKNTKSSPEEKIWLFVAQTDKTETSACIISPQQVNFLLNGKEVERRTNVSMDAGPQMPTNVTPMLKYGTNLLQAVGQFDGHYLIVVAFMSVLLPIDDPVLQDYDQASSGEPDPDSDLIEGPSRISLNCPISYTRIKIPVKGNSCKHHQCFDYRNFIHMNTRRPSWRCPHCNQHLCYNSIRIDQNMVKVLKDVGENVSDVIISADGSWKAVLEVDDNEGQKLDYSNGKSDQQDAAVFSTGVSTALDLTADNDLMDIADAGDIVDKKPSHPAQQSQRVSLDLTIPSQLNNGNATNPTVVSQIANSLWPNVLGQGSVLSSTSSDPQMINNFVPANTNVMTSHGSTNPTSAMVSRLSGNSQLQQSQHVNSTGANELVGSLPIQSPVVRIPTGEQSIASGLQDPSLLQRSRTNLNSVNTHLSSCASQVAPSMAPSGNGISATSHNLRQRQHPRSHNTASPMLQCQSSGQPQVLSGHPRNQHAGAHVASGHPSKSQNLLQHPNIGMPSASSLSPNVVRPSSLRSQMQTKQGFAQTGFAPSARSQVQTKQGFAQTGFAPSAANDQYSRIPIPGQRGVQMGSQPPSVPVQIQTPRTGAYLTNNNGMRTPMMGQSGNLGTIAASVNDSHADTPAEKNWRPSGRMRGSLSGQAYSSALRELMSQPTQSAQAPRPPSNFTLPPSNISPALQELLLNSRNAQASRTQSTTVTDSATVSATVNGITGAVP